MLPHVPSGDGAAAAAARERLKATAAARGRSKTGDADHNQLMTDSNGQKYRQTDLNKADGLSTLEYTAMAWEEHPLYTRVLLDL